MSQKDQIKEILSDKKRHCATEIIKKCYPIIDYRARLSSIKRELPANQRLESKPCNGFCGYEHKANMHYYQIVDVESTGQLKIL